MRKILARTLLNYSTVQLWDILTGEFILVMDDGELQTNAKATLYSSYGWDFHRFYTETPLLMKHHISGFMGKSRLGSGTHLKLLGNIMWSVYDHYVVNNFCALTNEPEIDFRDSLAEKVYQLTNVMYNDLSYRLGDDAVSLDIVDFIEALNHPEIKAANDSVQPTQKSIDATYAVIDRVLMNGTSLPNNPISLAARSKLASLGQIRQCLGPRGYLTDTDSHLFRHPILRGYAKGLRLFHDSLIESRSAAKSLIFSKTPLQQAEYFSRRLQLVSQVVQNLHMGDCGSTEYLLWTVRGPLFIDDIMEEKGDLDQLVGKHYMDDDGVLKIIGEKANHLIGRTLKLRSAMHCSHEDQYGICSTCFGELSLSVPKDTNIGQMCCTALAKQSSQSVLSVKHHDGNSNVDGVVIGPDDKQYLKVSPDKNSYMFADEMKGKEIYLIIPVDRAANITDVRDVKRIEDLSITQVSLLSEIGIKIIDKGVELPVSININHGRRLASMTYALLGHIRKTGWSINDRNCYVIDMKGWDWSKAIFTLPLTHFNMSDHSKEISSLLESSVGKMEERDKKVSPDAVIKELYELVNAKLNVNLAVLEVVLYSTMIISAEDGNYSLPKPGTTSGLSVMKASMANRSLSPAMAYQQHQEIITEPNSYTNTNRVDHPFDYLILPIEASQIGN